MLLGTFESFDDPSSCAKHLWGQQCIIFSKFFDVHLCLLVVDFSLLFILFNGANLLDAVGRTARTLGVLGLVGQFFFLLLGNSTVLLCLFHTILDKLVLVLVTWWLGDEAALDSLLKINHVLNSYTKPHIGIQEQACKNDFGSLL